MTDTTEQTLMNSIDDVTNVHQYTLQSILQLLNDFLLRQYALGDRVWAENTR